MALPSTCLVRAWPLTSRLRETRGLILLPRTVGLLMPARNHANRRVRSVRAIVDRWGCDRASRKAYYQERKQQGIHKLISSIDEANRDVRREGYRCFFCVVRLRTESISAPIFVAKRLTSTRNGTDKEISNVSLVSESIATRWMPRMTRLCDARNECHPIA